MSIRTEPQRLFVAVLALASVAGACEAPERVIIRTDGLGSVRQESREFKIDATRPTRNGNVVTTGVGLSLLATVESPTWEGVTLQATDVHWVGGTVFASYNVRGDRFRGALQVIDVTDPFHPDVTTEAIYPATDIARVRASGDSLFLAAADAEMGATFERFRYVDGALSHLGFEQLGSYSGTFLDIDDYLVHVSYGDEDGGVATFDVSSGDAVRVNEVSEHDARWVGATHDRGIAAIAGTPGRVMLFDGEGAVVAGSEIGAPTWATLRGDRLYLSSDTSGVLVLDMNDLSELGRLATGGTANGSGLAVAGRLAFLANGQEGLVVADFDDPAAPVLLASLDISDDAGSANAVSINGEYIALADGLGGVKILHYHRDVSAPSDDCDGDGITDDADIDDDNDGVLDEDDAEPCNPDLACAPDEGHIDHVARFVGDFYNLPCDHPDVEGRVTGVVPGNHPSDYDWWDDTYYVFSYERDSLVMSYSADYFPVDTGLCGDPFYFAAHWYTTAIVSEDGVYTMEIGSDDDSWLLIDGEVVTDLGGIHPLRRTSADVYLERGPHRIDVFFAERHVRQSGLEFEIVGRPEGALIDLIQHVCLAPDDDTDGDGQPNAADVSPLTVPEPAPAPESPTGPEDDADGR